MLPRSVVSFGTAPDRRRTRVRLGDAARVLDDDAGHPQADQGQAHRHAVVVVGLDRRRRAAAAGVIVRPSANSSTSAPSRRSSVARAAMRSVSLWRMWATLRIVVGPSANRRRRPGS